VASILAHLVLWPLGDRMVKLGRDRTIPERESTVMEVTLSPERDPADDDSVSAGKTVRLDALTDERPPQDATRVSEFDNSTERETVAPSRRRSRAATPQGRPKANDDRNAGPEPKSSNAPAPRGIALPLGGRRAVGGGAEPAGTGDKTATPPAPSFAPSPRSLRGLPGSRSKEAGQPGSSDKIDGVDEGDASILNAQRWKYASFFNRMMEGIDEHWDPVARLRARDPDGRINGTRTRTTRVMIILNPDGSLHKIKTSQSSNVDYLDEEAIQAIRKAAPFPNPPPGMLNPDDGKLHVPFGFIVEMGKGRIFRIKR